MFYKEKAPYLLTILFLALGWTISEVSTDLAKSPIVEYKSCKKIKTKEVEHIFTITNISSEKLFTKLKFVLRPEKTADVKCLGEPDIMIPSPTELKNIDQGSNPKKPECIEGKYAVYSLPQFQPGASIQLLMKTNKDATIYIHLWCEESVRLVESSFQTFILKKKFEFLMGLIVIWTILILIYLLLLPKK